MNFKELYDTEDPMLVCNVWDVESAKIAQQLDFKVIGTSSGAIATMLGYKDGEEISFDELEYIVGRITKNTNIPLTVDLESGYGQNSTEIVGNIMRLEQLGVVGINIEDSVVGDKREMVDADDFAKTLSQVCTQLANRNVETFVNVRTDTFLLNLLDPIEKTLIRAKKYREAGAQGLFVPCIEKEQDIEKVTKYIDLPLNVMCMPNLPNFTVLKSLGVKRISMGNFVYNKITGGLKNELQAVKTDQSFHQLFA